MSKALIIHVEVYDLETGVVESQTVYDYDSRCGLGYEVRNVFERLGAQFAKIVDPQDDYEL